MRIRATAAILFAACLAPCCLLAGPAYTDPAKTDADFPLQGEYVLEVTKDGKSEKAGLQVIAQGKGMFNAVYYPGGLPGDGANMKEKLPLTGAAKEGKLELKSAKGDIVVHIADKIAKVAGVQVGNGKRVERKSPTLGLKAPAGAVVLFDSSLGEKNLANFQKGARVTDDGLLMQGSNSEQKFGSCTLHLEFILPYQPEDRGQGRGNSGCYLQSRYETQILDSFGLEGKNNECGGIYTIKDPSVNMCFPPLQWQTYDIEYTAAQYDGDKKVKNARMTVKHNGVVVQDDTELTHATTASPLKEGPEPGPLHLQDHGNPVRFRNIWILEKK